MPCGKRKDKISQCLSALCRHEDKDG